MKLKSIYNKRISIKYLHPRLRGDDPSPHIQAAGDLIQSTDSLTQIQQS